MKKLIKNSLLIGTLMALPILTVPTNSNANVAPDQTCDNNPGGNNGHCTENQYGGAFCESDSWWTELFSNCVQ